MKLKLSWRVIINNAQCHLSNISYPPRKHDVAPLKRSICFRPSALSDVSRISAVYRTPWCLTLKRLQVYVYLLSPCKVLTHNYPVRCYVNTSFLCRLHCLASFNWLLSSHQHYHIHIKLRFPFVIFTLRFSGHSFCDVASASWLRPWTVYLPTYTSCVNRYCIC
jgi:hypothetical protein